MRELSSQDSFTCSCQTKANKSKAHLKLLSPSAPKYFCSPKPHNLEGQYAMKRSFLVEAVRGGDLEPYGHLACQQMPKRSMCKVLPFVKLPNSGIFCSEEASADSTETFSSTHCAHGPAKLRWDSHDANLLMFMRVLTIHATFNFSSCFLSRPKK